MSHQDIEMNPGWTNAHSVRVMERRTNNKTGRNTGVGAHSGATQRVNPRCMVCACCVLCCVFDLFLSLYLYLYTYHTYVYYVQCNGMVSVNLFVSLNVQRI